MTGSTLNLILISVVVVTVLAVWIVLVFYADAHPAAGVRPPPGTARSARRLARPPGSRSPARTPRPGRRRQHHRLAPDTIVPAERRMRTAAGKTRAA